MGEIVTFYSYKGGVGRTMALANAAVLLSKWGYRTLLVDWDLEAPGLEFYFREQLRDGPGIEGITQQQGITELLGRKLSDKVLAEDQILWQDQFLEITVFADSPPLHLITAGKRDESYFNKVRNLDIQTLYDEKDGGFFIESLRNEWKQAYDYVLIDSRTGITDIGGICTVQLPDILVLLFAANEQSLMGAVGVGIDARRARHDLPFDRYSLLTLPIPSRFDSRVEFDISQMWLDRFVQEASPLYANWLPRDIDRRAFLEATKIPYMAYFSFGEKLPVLQQGTTDPAGLGYAYETLAALIANKLSYVEQLPENRGKFVRLASGAEVSESLESDNQAIIPAAHKKVYKAQRLGDRIILPSELLRKSRDILLKCDELSSYEALRAVFVWQELAPFRDLLPMADNMSDRVNLTIDLLLNKISEDGRPVFSLFLAVLRERYSRGDALHSELTELIEAFGQSLQDIKAIGQTIEIPFVVLAMTRDEAMALFNQTIFDDPNVAPIERTRFRNFVQTLGEENARFIYHYGETREDWIPFADPKATIHDIVSDIVERINSMRDTSSRLILLRPAFLSSLFLEEDWKARETTMRQLEKTGGVVIVDAISLFHPVLSNAFNRTAMDFDWGRLAIAVIAPPNNNSVRIKQFLEDALKSRMPRLYFRYTEMLDRMVEIGIQGLLDFQRWQFAVLPEMGKMTRTQNWFSSWDQAFEQTKIRSTSSLSDLFIDSKR